MRIISKRACIALVAVSVVTSTSIAQDLVTAAASGQSAQLAEARRAALAQLESGTLNAKTLVPVYRAIAETSARLEQSDEARHAFTVLLALDPSFRVDASAPDTLRSPYMEARGFLSSFATTLDAAAQLEDNGAGLRIAIVDPAHIAARLRVRMRVAPGREFVETVRPIAESVAVTIAPPAGESGVDYSLALLDEYGNRLFQLGSDTEPHHLAGAAPSAAPLAPLAVVPVVAAESVDGRQVRGYYVLGSLALAAGGAAITGAALAHKERQDLARQWNRADCTNEGTTRSMICRGERTRITDMQNLAIALYAAGGVALAAGIILFAVAPPRAREARASRGRMSAWSCGDGPGRWGVACTVGF